MKTKPFEGVKMGKTKKREYKIGRKKLKNVKMFEEFNSMNEEEVTKGLHLVTLDEAEHILSGKDGFAILAIEGDLVEVEEKLLKQIPNLFEDFSDYLIIQTLKEEELNDVLLVFKEITKYSEDGLDYKGINDFPEMDKLPFNVITIKEYFKK